MIDRPSVEEFIASNGARIFRLPLEVFPDYMAFAHLVVHDDSATLVDTGSGFDSSNEDLVAGFAAVRDDFGVDVVLDGLSQVIITHGHIDHIGGLAFVLSRASSALVAAHELARPVLSDYRQRTLVTQHALARFLRIAGVSQTKIEQLLEMFLLGKQYFRFAPLHVALRDGAMVGGTFQVVHVPGHAPGLIMLQIGDVLLTADHILPNTSVALAPEMIMPYTGVGHYLESLEKAERLAGVRVALGGHERPMHDYYAAAAHSRDNAVKKIDLVRDLCREPRTIAEIACQVYDALEGYSELLKLEQIGARVEYLHQRGLLVIDNLENLDDPEDEAWRFVLAPQA